MLHLVTVTVSFGPPPAEGDVAETVELYLAALMAFPEVATVHFKGGSLNVVYRADIPAGDREVAAAAALAPARAIARAFGVPADVQAVDVLDADEVAEFERPFWRRLAPA